jgi:nucleoside-diphosphate-sugar epimerase
MVAGMTRSPGKADMLKDLGAEPLVCDVFDAAALAEAVAAFRPDVVFHELTDLPDDAGELSAHRQRNDRVRTEGTRNLLAAAGSSRTIAQSISWEVPGEGGAAAAEHERLVLTAGGVVIRYGQFYGPGTFYPETPPDPPRIHVDAAARQSLVALDVPAGVTIVVDDRAAEG